MTNKRIIAVLSAIIVVVGVFAACNQHTETAVQTTASVAVTEVVALPSEESSVPETEAESSRADTTSETEPVRSNSTTVRETTTQRTTATTRKTTTTTTEAATTKPSTTKKSETTTKKETATAKKTTTTTTTTTTQKNVDIGSFVTFAKNYGKSIGLNYDSSVTECWDNPITVTSTNGESAKRDIKSRLNRYKNVEDFTDFSVWYEKRSDGKYDLYIGYN